MNNFTNKAKDDFRKIFKKDLINNDDFQFPTKENWHSKKIKNKYKGFKKRAKSEYKSFFFTGVVNNFDYFNAEAIFNVSQSLIDETILSKPFSRSMREKNVDGIHNQTFSIKKLRKSGYLDKANYYQFKTGYPSQHRTYKVFFPTYNTFLNKKTFKTIINVEFNKNTNLYSRDIIIYSNYPIFSFSHSEGLSKNVSKESLINIIKNIKKENIISVEISIPFTYKTKIVDVITFKKNIKEILKELTVYKIKNSEEEYNKKFFDKNPQYRKIIKDIKHEINFYSGMTKVANGHSFEKKYLKRVVDNYNNLTSLPNYENPLNKTNKDIFFDCEEYSIPLYCGCEWCYDQFGEPIVVEENPLCNLEAIEIIEELEKDCNILKNNFEKWEYTY